MRIAVVFDCFFPASTGGGERLYRLFAESFHAQGWEVDYLTRRQWEGAAPDAPGMDVVAVSGPSELYDEHGARKPLLALVFAWGVFWHLVRDRRRYDAVLVSALPVLNVFAVRLALLGTRARICSDFLEIWRREQWIEYSGPVVGRVAAWLQHRAVRASPLVSAHSRLSAGRLVEDGARRPPVVSPGLIHGIEAADPVLVAAQPPTVVYVGRHIPDKQVESIPAAVLAARRDIPELRAVILGDGQQRDAVVREVRRLGLDQVVDLPGFVPQPVLDAAIRSAAVLVNPSRREGYGLVVVEACALGTPVVLVAGEDNAAVELVAPGVNGFVAESTAPDVLAAAVNGFVAESTAPDVLAAALVEAVRGGPQLRASARRWFERAAVERTADAAARGILDALRSAG